MMLNPYPPNSPTAPTSIGASVHVELVGGRREAVGQSGGGGGAGQRAGQVRPGHGDGVVDVHVAAGTCHAQNDVVLGVRSETGP